MKVNTLDKNKITINSKIFGIGAICKIRNNQNCWEHPKNTDWTYSEYPNLKQIKINAQNFGDIICKKANIDTGAEKVIALTIDDGPSEEYTNSILKILQKYNAKATFFVIGNILNEKWAKNIVFKEYQMGNQVCTHSYSHAKNYKLNFSLMPKRMQIEEIFKGNKAISDVLKNFSSDVVRLPGGNFNAETLGLLAPYVSTVVNWNIDTEDWKMPGVNNILREFNKTKNGSIVLCHDGGGNRSQTVEALEVFVEKYSSMGYKFITINELLKYPMLSKPSSNTIIDESTFTL